MAENAGAEVAGDSVDSRPAWPVLAHAAALIGLVVPSGNITGPWIVLLARGHRAADVEQHAKESLNFQLSMTAYTASVALMASWVGLTLMLVAPLVVFKVVMVVLAATRARKGQTWRYPAAIRFIR